MLLAALLGAALAGCAAGGRGAANADIAPSRKATPLDEKAYYAPGEDAAAASSQPAPGGASAPAPGAATNPAPAEEHVAREDPFQGRRVNPLVPAFPARMEQTRLRDMQTVYFEFDRAELTADAQRVLEADLAWLKAHPEVKVRVEGHCDERGTSEYNLALGSRRANGVREFFIQRGVPAERLTPVSYGEELPLKAGHDEEAWRWNRRVEFSNAEPPQAAPSQPAAPQPAPSRQG
jgi:peptidoglycan-associated lipoprotein